MALDNVYFDLARVLFSIYFEIFPCLSGSEFVKTSGNIVGSDKLMWEIDCVFFEGAVLYRDKKWKKYF